MNKMRRKRRAARIAGTGLMEMAQSLDIRDTGNFVELLQRLFNDQHSLRRDMPLKGLRALLCPMKLKGGWRLAILNRKKRCISIAGHVGQLAGADARDVALV